MIISMRDDAIASLCPTAKYALAGDEITWLDEDITQPTESEITVDGQTLDPLTLDYTDKRANAYPSIEEQLDMQYHDSVNGTTTWKDAITNVKSSIPKTA